MFGTVFRADYGYLPPFRPPPPTPTTSGRLKGARQKGFRLKDPEDLHQSQLQDHQNHPQEHQNQLQDHQTHNI